MRGLKRWHNESGASLWNVASSREDAWIETDRETVSAGGTMSRPPARTRGLKRLIWDNWQKFNGVASSREDAWIETAAERRDSKAGQVASSREDAWIETAPAHAAARQLCRVLPRGRVD